MYKPTDNNTIYEIRGEILDPNMTSDAEKRWCLFGYSRINGYDPKKRIAYANDLGEWVHYENIYEVDNTALPCKKKKVIALLSKKQLLAFKDDDTAKWLTIDKTLKDMRKKVAAEAIFKDILKKYIKSDITGYAKDFLNAVSYGLFPYPVYLVNKLGMTKEDYNKLIANYYNNYTGMVDLPWNEYLYKAYSVIQEILDSSDGYWTRPYERKKRSFKEIDNLSYSI